MTKKEMKKMKKFKKMVSVKNPMDSWESYVEMVSGVYFNQKTRSPLLDKLHDFLIGLGTMMNADPNNNGSDQVVAYINHLCVQMTKIAYLSLDVKGNTDYIYGKIINDQVKDALSFAGIRSWEGERMDSILKYLILTAFKNPEQVLYFMD